MIIIQRILCFHLLNMFYPLRMVCSSGIISRSLRRTSLDISDHRRIYHNILIDLCRIDIDLKDLWHVLQKSCAFPVTRSLKRAPMTIRRSHCVTPRLEVLVPCIPSIPVYRGSFSVKTLPCPSGCRTPEPGSCAPDSCISSDASGDHSTASDKDIRLLCFLDHLLQPSQDLPLRIVSVLTVDRSRTAARIYSVTGCCHILGDIHQYRTRTSALGNIKCLADRICQHL